jgi:hypothetical protein
MLLLVYIPVWSRGLCAASRKNIDRRMHGTTVLNILFLIIDGSLCVLCLQSPVIANKPELGVFFAPRPFSGYSLFRSFYNDVTLLFYFSLPIAIELALVGGSKMNTTFFRRNRDYHGCVLLFSSRFHRLLRLYDSLWQLKSSKEGNVKKVNDSFQIEAVPLFQYVGMTPLKTEAVRP